VATTQPSEQGATFARTTTKGATGPGSKITVGPNPFQGTVGPKGGAAVAFGILRNYEAEKLQVSRPDVYQGVMLLVVGVLAWASIGKRAPAPLLDRGQTDQLKGVAIIVIIVSHVSIHVCGQLTFLRLNGDGVTIFLMLSGFGLTVSSGTQRPRAMAYAASRVRRVMLPYWLATAVILTLDAALLRRVLGLRDLALTLLGLNYTPATRHLDYARWFVTFILAWYFLFYVAMILREKLGLDVLVFLFSCSLAIYLLDHFVCDWAYQEFAFPAGCALGRYRDRIKALVKEDGRRWTQYGLALVVAGLIYQAGMPAVYPKLWPMVFFRLSFQVASIALAMGLVILCGQMGDRGRFSAVLAIFGTVSYELFLLHGPLLIKYNPVFGMLPAAALPASFLLLLALLLALSLGFRKVLLMAMGRWAGG
jgi:peptidoglycan/LPS O-acetylase OafA/YrhL